MDYAEKFRYKEAHNIGRKKRLLIEIEPNYFREDFNQQMLAVVYRYYTIGKFKSVIETDNFS